MGLDVSVFGTGYVGLVQAVALAEVGHQVVCVDVDHEKIDRLKRGIPPIHEPGLQAMLERNARGGRIRFTTDPCVAIRHGDLIFIAVGTPPTEDGSADIQAVLNIAKNVSERAESPKILVIKSTVPVGTADQLREQMAAQAACGSGRPYVAVVSNPEFLKEGCAVYDCMTPDRVIIGCADDHSAKQMEALYAPFTDAQRPIQFMDNRSAEMVKYAANAMLACRISFMNEIANLSESMGVDIRSVRRGIGSDPRIGADFINAGCGFGGSCFPKDLLALVTMGDRLGHSLNLLRSVTQVNDDQRHILFRKLNSFYPDGLQGKVIGVWGLAFKPDTGDMREAPSRYLMEALWAAGAKVQAYDPEAMIECQRIYGQRPDLLLCDAADDVLQDAQALIICTEWQAFKAADLAQVAARLSSRLVIDGRNLFDPVAAANAGLRYYGVGLPFVAPAE